MKLTLLLFTVLTVLNINGQQTGYYNNTDGKSGDELKAALNDIIKGHTPFTYRSAKYIFNLSDADPNNSSNVILVYTGRSHPNDDYGTGGNYINREHVWAKSHGSFADWMPMDGDVHNLKPADASVNVAKSNKDFDDGGVQHDEATGCYFTDSTWEARDEVKGDIARIIFYMSTRYEGNDGEIDLEVVDWNNTFPHAEHGKLSTLLEWNLLDPPDDFERNRNNVIFSFQKNRNPFIDNPEFAQLMWGGGTASDVHVEDLAQMPEVVFPGDIVEISAVITSTGGAVSSATIYWGTSYESLTNQIEMAADGDVYTVSIPEQIGGQTIYYKIVATDGTNENAPIVFDYYTNKVYSGEFVSIYDIQGQQESSPLEDQVVTTSGIVTANLGMSYFIQDGTGLWNGLFIYDNGRNPSIGDSIVVTGKIVEYYGLTEMKEIEDYYFVSSNHELPELVDLATGEAEEGHEGILAKVTSASCVNANYQGNYGMWTVNDGTGELEIRNTAIFEYDPTEGLTYDITGPVNWDYSEWKIELRSNNDVVESVDTDGPVVESAEPVISTNIKVMFNEEVDKETAEDITNYVINNSVIIESASQHALNKAQVNLTVSEMSYGDFMMTVASIKDLSGNVMTEQLVEFSYVGVDELFVNGEVSIYPNPVDNQLNIEFAAKDNLDLSINLTDISGRVIIQNSYSATAGTNKYQLNLSDISRGVYFLSITENSGSLKYKVVVR